MKWKVVVGGWRTVGTYDTHQEALDKANTCISSHVQIIETGEE
tara:strand:- start:363 stop:491 length:129 start_codon:yes stop_codon:yes gene_type:complete